MKYFAIVLITVICSGCTSLKPIDLPPEQLQGQIVAEEIIKAGQQVKITTLDGKTHEFEVTEIRNDHILGKDIDIPVKNIAALENRVVSAGKTVALVGGTAAGLYVGIIILIVIFAPAVFLL